MIRGLLVGIGMMFPGISGGIIAVILNVYDKTIYTLSNFKKDVKKSVNFLFPLFFGILMGIIISAKFLKYIFNSYYFESCYLFIGLILGTIPYLINTIKLKSNSKINFAALLISLLISIFIAIIGKNETFFLKSSLSVIPNIYEFFFAGFIFALGKIIPGISSSFMLITIGMYDWFLNIISNPIQTINNYLYQMVFLGLGVIVGSVIFIKLISYFFKKFYNITYSVIIGFVVGSIIIICPNHINFIGFLLLVLGFLLSYKLSITKKIKSIDK